MLFKIDGGPGRLDIKSLAELGVRGMFLFSGVQNTTHITQETDQNYGEFETLLRKHIQQLLNDMFAKYREQQLKKDNPDRPYLYHQHSTPLIMEFYSVGIPQFRKRESEKFLIFFTAAF